MATDDLTCRELVELVTEYLEGALPLPKLGFVHLERGLKQRTPGCR